MFKGDRDFRHGTVQETGVLLVNLGTPQAPTKQALRPYLKQFLWDPRVIEMSRPLWWLILNGIILTTRPKKSAALYKKVWTPEGSPLLVNSRKQTKALEAALQKQFGDRVRIALGMCYGEPSLPRALAELRDQNVRRVLVLPLYPQYSGTTTAAMFDAIVKELMTWRWVPELRTINNYHDHPGYIGSVANSIRRFWERKGRAKHLLISFHGIPKNYFLDGDPYYCHCVKTGRLVAEALGLPESEYTISFQSLFGRGEWLRPYTNETLKAFGEAKLESLDVVCPGFTSDCLETLEEIEEENREVFVHAGGGQYRYIPAVNDNPDFILALSALVTQHLQGWVEPGASLAEQNALRAQAAQSEQLYQKAANIR